MTQFIGVDIGKDFFDVATVEQAKAKRFKNTPEGYKACLKWLPNEDVKVAMEATGKYSLGLALALYDQGIPVSVVNPVRINLYAESQLKCVKTDSEDAKIIAHFCMTQTPQALAARYARYRSVTRVV
ncbi:MAG: IS110 family transposase [Pseudomonadota bacterium]